MIVVDIETSGLRPLVHGIWQIGAIDVRRPERFFLREGMIDREDEIDPGSLRVTKKTEEYLRDSRKETQIILLKRFFNWVNSSREKILVSKPSHFEYQHLTGRARKYGLEIPFNDVLDLSTLFQKRYHEIYGEFCYDGIGMRDILEFCGLEREIEHDALKDAKQIAECFSRIFYGKPLLPEYSFYPISEQLKKTKRELELAV